MKPHWVFIRYYHFESAKKEKFYRAYCVNTACFPTRNILLKEKHKTATKAVEWGMRFSARVNRLETSPSIMI